MSQRSAARRRRGNLPIAPALLACAVLALLCANPATAAIPPRAATGAVTHVRGVSALLTGSINPEGQETTYYFEYGPTIAYGSRTPSAIAGSGTTIIKVGQTVAPILPGYHYRLVAFNASGPTFGHDRTYTAASTKLKLELFKPPEPATLGTAVVVSGALTGLGNANHRIALQQSAFPYLEPFFPAGLPTVTGPTGRFSFHVGVLTRSTQFRVVTLDPLPLFSPILTERVAVRVTFKVRPSGRRGFVRLYGTVTPAERGAVVRFQLQKPARPGSVEQTEERTFRWATQFSTLVKRATRSFSRFSSIVKVHRAGLYRAVVIVPPGPLVSGASATLPLHAASTRRR